MSLLFEELAGKECEAAETNDAYEKGYAEGMAEGIATEKIEIAMKMKSRNLDNNLIEEITGLSAEQLEEL